MQTIKIVFAWENNQKRKRKSCHMMYYQDLKLYNFVINVKAVSYTTRGVVWYRKSILNQKFNSNYKLGFDHSFS